jgi:glycosyltransferase involved in cell wall biosynthesis
MSATRPLVDVNLLVHNGAATIAATLDCVLAEVWRELAVTVIDNASSDGTAEIAAAYAARDGRVRVLRNRANVGPVLNCQRAFWHGTADFVLPKTADDLLAPDYVETLMEVLLAEPGCVLCHAAGLVFDDAGRVRMVYPPEHLLDARGADPVARACAVMARYTSAPAFWGIWRRAAVDLLPAISYRAGWDHAVLAELALYGEIRSVAALLFWRRHGGKDVAVLAQGCSEWTQRGLPLDDGLAELRWRTPLVTTAYAHVERFALVRLPAAQRLALIAAAPRIFRDRWLPMMRREGQAFRAAFPDLLEALAATCGAAAQLRARHLLDALTALDTILPGEGFGAMRLEVVSVVDAVVA